MRRTRQRIAAMGLIVPAMVGAVACGQEKPAVCKQVDALRASVRQLQNTSLSENGMGSMSTVLMDVRSQLSILRTEASTQFQPQIAAVQTSVDQLQQRVSEAKAAPTVQAFGQVGVALGGVRTTMKDLGQAFGSTC